MGNRFQGDPAVDERSGEEQAGGEDADVVSANERTETNAESVRISEHPAAGTGLVLGIEARQALRASVHRDVQRANHQQHRRKHLLIH